MQVLIFIGINVVQVHASVTKCSCYFAHCVSVNFIICQSHTVSNKTLETTTNVINSTKPGTVHILRLWIFASLHLTTADLRNFSSRNLYQLLMSVCISRLTALVCRFKSSIAIAQARLKNKQKDAGTQKTRTLAASSGTLWSVCLCQWASLVVCKLVVQVDVLGCFVLSCFRSILYLNYMYMLLL